MNITNEQLQALCESVAAALGESTIWVELTYGGFAYGEEGRFGWNCQVKARRKKRGRGSKQIRPGFFSIADNPAEAVADVLRQIHDYQHPEEVAAQNKRDALRRTLDDLRASGQLSEDDYAKCLAKIGE